MSARRRDLVLSLSALLVALAVAGDVAVYAWNAGAAPNHPSLREKPPEPRAETEPEPEQEAAPEKEVAPEKEFGPRTRLAFVKVVLPPPPADRGASQPSPTTSGATASAPTAPAPTILASGPAARPLPVPEPVATPAREPGPGRAERVAAVPKPARSSPPPAAVETVAVANAGAARHGGALLRLLELGDGPDIRLGWPEASAEREALHDLLARCHGLTLALMGADGRLDGVDEVVVARSSALAREIDGPLARREARRLDDLRIKAGGTGIGRPVRLFDRGFDRRLLGGLARLIERPIAEARTIRAALSARGREVVVDGIQVDGALLPGRIVIPPSVGCR